MDRLQEIEIKVERVRSLMSTERLAAVALSTQANFAWITGGSDNHVGLSAEGGVATVLITAIGRHVITSAIEAPRFADEEISDLGFDLHIHRWYDQTATDLIMRLAEGGTVAADSDLPTTQNMSSVLSRLRWQLLPVEIERYRIVGQEGTRILEETARQIEPGMSELDVAGLLQGKAFAAGLLPNVCLVAADERAYRYRHPIPTQKPIRQYVMLVLGVRRWGLAVSATRLVHFGPLPDVLAKRHQAVCSVDACLILGSRPGAKVADVFAAACREYAHQGFPDEWQFHHQGGATGYAPREYRAGPTSAEIILNHQAFAWNPSISGTKSEDTILATEAGPEILTKGHDWPLLPITYGGQTLLRPAIMVR
ncbi:MAG: M24 family metallopeptidase [Candidatus Zipacnadales bacterium]